MTQAEGPAAHTTADPGVDDLTQPAAAAVPQPAAEPDTETTLDAATTPSNTPVEDPAPGPVGCWPPLED